MRIHYLQHVPFEGIGSIRDWTSARGHSLAGTEMAQSPVPHPDAFDFLVVMGGPMNIYQEREHPWLRETRSRDPRAWHRETQPVGSPRAD